MFWRKKMKKVFLTMLAVCMLIVSLAGCSFEPEKKFEFEKYGFSITLTDEFVEDDYVEFKIYLKSQKIIFLANYETKQTLSSSGVVCNTAKDYADMLILNSNLTSTAVVDSENNWVKFEYSATVDDSDFTYFAYVMQSGDRFWSCQFCVETKNAENLKEKIEKYAKSIVITEK